MYRLILGDFHQHGKQLGKMGFLIVLRCACLVKSLEVGSDYSALCIQMLDYVKSQECHLGVTASNPCLTSQMEVTWIL